MAGENPRGGRVTISHEDKLDIPEHFTESQLDPGGPGTNRAHPYDHGHLLYAREKILRREIRFSFPMAFFPQPVYPLTASQRKTYLFSFPGHDHHRISPRHRAARPARRIRTSR